MHQQNYIPIVLRVIDHHMFLHRTTKHLRKNVWKNPQRQKEEKTAHWQFWLLTPCRTPRKNSHSVCCCSKFCLTSRTCRGGVSTDTVKWAWLPKIVKKFSVKFLVMKPRPKSFAVSSLVILIFALIQNVRTYVRTVQRECDAQRLRIAH